MRRPIRVIRAIRSSVFRSAEFSENRPLEVFEAFSGYRRDFHEFEVALGAPAREFLDFPCNGGVHFRGDDDLGFTRKVGIVPGEFGVNRVELIDRIAVAHGGHVDQMEKQPCAFDVLQELDTEAGAKMRAFNQAGTCRYRGRRRRGEAPSS